jgi:hypothetical protein
LRRIISDSATIVSQSNTADQAVVAALRNAHRFNDDTADAPMHARAYPRQMQH